MPKYPGAFVQLAGEDGNAFSVIGRTELALRNAGVAEDEIVAFVDEAIRGEYDHVLATVMNWVSTA